MGSSIGKLVFFVFITSFFLSSGCSVKDPPQNKAAYQPVPYVGQVSQQTLKQLKSQYPKGFFKLQGKVVPETKKLRIGFVSFVGSGPLAPLAAPITEIFSTTFVQSGLFKVYSREKMDKVVAEVELGMTGLVDPATAQQAGKLAGLQFLITGKLSELPSNQQLDVKIIDIASGQIVLVDQVEGVINSDNSQFLARRLADRLAKKYYPQH